MSSDLSLSWEGLMLLRTVTHENQHVSLLTFACHCRAAGEWAPHLTRGVRHAALVIICEARRTLWSRGMRRSQVL